jgi:formate--tetrahydrofolate ligase
VCTIRSLKYHGGLSKEDIKNESIEALLNGTKNLLKHIENIKEKFGLNVIVAINKFDTDTENEINTLKDVLSKENVELSLSEGYFKGGEGVTDLARKVVDLCEKKNDFKYIYDLEDDIVTKIEKVSKNIYGAEGIKLDEGVLDKIKNIEKLGYKNYPICIAKTQYSLSDDPKNLECNDKFDIHVKDVWLRTGAEFIVVLTGKIMTMPGLPKKPAAEQIDIDEDGNIVGIF